MKRMALMFTWISAVALTLQGCFKIDQYEFPNELNHPPVVLEEPCNGHPELCGLRYDQVAYPTTHNSFNYEFGTTNFLFPNQDVGVAQQLNDGIRGLMLDVYDEGGELVVYHGFSFTGSDPLQTPLRQIRDFLDENPREVVSIIFETEVDGNAIGDALADADLLDRVYTHPAGSEWNTLSEMIQMNKRLVVFTENESQAGTPEWFHYAWGEIVDTPYDYQSSADFTCDYNRGNAGNALFLVNHWITAPLVGTGMRDSAAVVNQKEVLLTRVQNCLQSHHRMQANFVAVDFYREGDLLEVVRVLNGVE